MAGLFDSKVSGSAAGDSLVEDTVEGDGSHSVIVSEIGGSSRSLNNYIIHTLISLLLIIYIGKNLYILKIYILFLFLIGQKNDILRIDIQTL